MTQNIIIQKSKWPLNKWKRKQKKITINDKSIKNLIESGKLKKKNEQKRKRRKNSNENI